ARGIGFWRLGDGENIKLDDHTGTYFDFARGEGGGILALIQKVRECSKQEALRWLADMAGIPFSTDRRRRQDTAPIWMQAKVWGWQRECLASLEQNRRAFSEAYYRAFRYLFKKGLDAPA